ncbi:MAG: hypothetical protein IPN77_33720 [Sandaracinaceae bacterium]|nr:hypothetical protein [Sandaracinaceae bacterium]
MTTTTPGAAGAEPGPHLGHLDLRGRGHPLRALVDAVLLEADEAVKRLTEAQAPLQEALRLGRALLAGSSDSDSVLAAAERADAIAEDPVGSYRSLSTQPVVTPSEALFSAELSLHSTFGERAVQRRHVGRGHQRGDARQLARAVCLNPAALGRDPVQRVALFVPAAVAEAVAQLLLASQRRMTTAAPSELAADMNARVGALLSPFVRA